MADIFDTITLEKPKDIFDTISPEPEFSVEPTPEDIAVAEEAKHYPDWYKKGGDIFDKVAPEPQARPMELWPGPEPAGFLRKAFGYISQPEPPDWKYASPLEKASFAIEPITHIFTRIGGKIVEELGLRKKEDIQKVLGDEIAEDLKWYQKSPEAIGWGMEKTAEYLVLSGIFRLTGLHRVLTKAGQIIAKPFLAKQLATQGGAQTLKTLSKKGMKELGRKTLTSFLEAAPENTQFIGSWSALDALKKGKEPTEIGKEYVRGVKVGLIWTAAISAIGNVVATPEVKSAVTKAVSALNRKYPRIVDLVGKDVEPELMNEAVKAYNKARGTNVKFVDLPKTTQAYIRNAVRAAKGEVQKVAQKEAQIRAYYEAGRKAKPPIPKKPEIQIGVKPVKPPEGIVPIKPTIAPEAITPAEPTPIAPKPTKAVKPIGKPGFVDVTPVLKAHKTFMRVLEPSKAVERKLGKEAYAAVIKGVHATDAARVKFEQTELPKKDKVFNELEGWLDKFPDKDLDNLMLSRGEPVSVEAQLIKRDAINKLPKELRSPRLIKTIQHIADFNYKYLQSVVGDDINRVSEYFYGIYKDSKKVDKFLDYWRTTKRFTKEKKLPTYADAKAWGLEIRDSNPVRNLKSEYVAIAHLEGMNWLKDELMRTGKGKFIDEMFDAPVEWDKIQDPTFRGLRVQPDLAKLINNLIATNKITKVPVLNTLREVNNFLRTIKFIGSAFHLLSVAKQSVADSGYLGFYKIAKFEKRPGKRIPFGVRKGTAIQGITFGFRKNDPIFKTLQYRDYIRHGGTHRYSVEAEARKTFTKAVASLNKEMGKAVKFGAIPLKIPVTFVNWMFNSYIPKVKYAKYLDFVAEKQKKLGRPLTSPEKTDIIKEQQNFYGMMNERLFGRSGTVTTALRFYFMSPGYAEGNYRTMIKAAIQWGGKGGFNATRSRSNIVNSLILTGTLAAVGTMIMTGKLPKKPETAEDLRDLFKIDTGKTDDKGRRIMIDMMTYDKDYWNIGFNVLKGRPDEAVKVSIKRIGGMKAPTADMITDLALISMGKAVYDWKGDRVTEITDPFLLRVMKLTVHEIRKLEPISVSVFKQSRRREIDTTIAAIESLLGVRPTKTEKDKREQAITNRIYSLKGQQEKLYQYLGTLKEPRKAIDRYNKTVNQVLNSKMVPQKMRKEWEPKLLIDVERLLSNKAYYLTSPNRTDEEIERAKKYLANFGVTSEEAQEYLNKYWARERKKVPVSPLERDRVIGRGRKRRRLAERMQE